MAFLLRGIEKRRWNKEEAKHFNWLLSNDFPADPLADLRTQGNALSFWHIEEDQSNLERVAAAIACTKGNLDNFDFGLINAPSI